MSEKDLLDEKITVASDRPSNYEELLRYAVKLIVELEYAPANAIKMIMERKNVDKATAEQVVEEALKSLNSATKGKAVRDIVIGGLFFVGGTVGTLANIGYIFWGAIIFGGIQMVRGIIAFSQNK